MFIFGCLTYQNIRQTIALLEQQADRQLVKMILMQIVFVTISVIPYDVNSLYNLITAGITKDAVRQQKELFATTIVSLLAYTYFAVQFP